MARYVARDSGGSQYIVFPPGGNALVIDVTNGRVGVGKYPSSNPLEVQGTLAVTNLDVSGDTTFNGVTYSWPSSDGSGGQVLATDGSGNLSWTTVGGTDEHVKADSSDPSAGYLDAKVDGDSIDVNTSTHQLYVRVDGTTIQIDTTNHYIELAPGGITDTHISSSANIAWSKISKSGSSIADLATRDASDVDYDNTSSGLSATDVQSAIDELDTRLDNNNLGTFTSGSVIFADGSGNLSEDNSNFYWDDSNDRLGILTNSPATALDVRGIASLQQQILLYDSTHSETARFERLANALEIDTGTGATAINFQIATTTEFVMTANELRPNADAANALGYNNFSGTAYRYTQLHLSDGVYWNGSGGNATAYLKRDTSKGRYAWYAGDGYGISISSGVETMVDSEESSIHLGSTTNTTRDGISLGYPPVDSSTISIAYYSGETFSAGAAGLDIDFSDSQTLNADYVFLNLGLTNLTTITFNSHKIYGVAMTVPGSVSNARKSAIIALDGNANGGLDGRIEVGAFQWIDHFGGSQIASQWAENYSTQGSRQSTQGLNGRIRLQISPGSGTQYYEMIWDKSEFLCNYSDGTTNFPHVETGVELSSNSHGLTIIMGLQDYTNSNNHVYLKLTWTGSAWQVDAVSQNDPNSEESSTLVSTISDGYHVFRFEVTKTNQLVAYVDGISIGSFTASNSFPDDFVGPFIRVEASNPSSTMYVDFDYYKITANRVAAVPN